MKHLTVHDMVNRQNGRAMGSDIHMMAEVRKGGKWKAVTDEVFPNPFHDPGSEHFSKEFTADPHRGQNYFLFAILADVRNYDEVKPFNEPRGVPEDASPEWLEAVDAWSGDMHSKSFYTLRELQDAPWDNTFTWRTLTTPEAAKKYRETGEWPKVTFRGSVGPCEEVARQVTYREAAGYFVEKTMPTLAQLGAPDDVRVVFGFDN